MLLEKKEIINALKNEAFARCRYEIFAEVAREQSPQLQLCRSHRRQERRTATIPENLRLLLLLTRALKICCLEITLRTIQPSDGS